VLFRSHRQPRQDRTSFGRAQRKKTAADVRKRVLEQSFPHIRGRFLALCAPETGSILAGLPVYTVNSWLLGTRMVSVPFSSLCDPLITDAEQLHQLLPALDAARQQASASRLELRVRKAASCVTGTACGVESIYKHHVLDFERPPDEIFRLFAKSSICQKIRKAEKAGVTVVDASGAEDLRVCYDILAQTRRRLSLPPMPFKLFSAMRRHLAGDALVILIARHQGKPIGCHLLLTSDKLWISEHSGNADGAVHGTNQLLYWHAIQRAHKAGAKAFSFGRTAASNIGLLEYKRRWAAAEEDLFEFVRPAPTRLIAKPAAARSGNSSAYRFVKSIIRRAPMPVCEAIGRFCYRHLG